MIVWVPYEEDIILEALREDDLEEALEEEQEMVLYQIEQVPHQDRFPYPQIMKVSFLIRF